MRSPAVRGKRTNGAQANSTGSASQVSAYHTLLARAKSNPKRWADLAVTIGREAVGNIIEQGIGKTFLAFAFDPDGKTLGTFSSRKAARRAVCEAFQRRQVGAAA